MIDSIAVEDDGDGEDDAVGGNGGNGGDGDGGTGIPYKGYKRVVPASACKVFLYKARHTKLLLDAVHPPSMGDPPSRLAPARLGQARRGSARQGLPMPDLTYLSLTMPCHAASQARPCLAMPVPRQPKAPCHSRQKCTLGSRW